MTLQDPRPSKWLLFRIWAGIGLQSFGGGASTTFLIQRAFIEKHKWLTMEEFLHTWNLCILTPGINLLACTILLGRRMGGAWGVVVSLAGMLLPSTIITCLLAAGFKLIEQAPAVQAILHGVVPATAGILLLVGLNFSLPLAKRGSKVGWVYLLGSALLMLICTVAVIVIKISVIIVILGAILLGAFFFSTKAAPLPGRDESRLYEEEKPGPPLLTEEQGESHD